MFTSVGVSVNSLEKESAVKCPGLPIDTRWVSSLFCIIEISSLSLKRNLINCRVLMWIAF